MDLRKYQTDLLEKVREQFRAGRKRIVMYAPTGSGKTECAMEMIRAARRRKTKVAFVANRIGLVEQASQRFYKSGIEHGVIQGNNTRNADSGVLVCSIQTLQKRGYPEAGLIVIDEAHGAAGSQAYRGLIMAYENCPVVGLSATPFSRGLGKIYPDFGALFQGIAYSVTIRQLIDLGFLVDVDIWAPTTPDLTGVKIVAGDYHEGQLAAAVDKPTLIGDIVTHWKRLGKNKPTVCFATNIAHSKHIMEQFVSAGISCEHLDCYTEDDDRRAILGRVNRGDTKVVTNCAVLAEGWDQPSVEIMICARPTKSLVRWIQMSGRILRPFPGKERGTILDHSGTAVKLGFPTDDLPLVLDDGKPHKAAEREREEPLPKECQKCHYLKPPKTHVCPACGFAPEKIDTIEVEEGKLAKLRRTPLKKMTTDQKQKIYAELVGYARERKIKDGWAYFAFKELFDVGPPRSRLAPVPPSEETRDLIRHMNIKRAKSRAKAQNGNAVAP